MVHAGAADDASKGPGRESEAISSPEARGSEVFKDCEERNEWPLHILALAYT